MTNLKMTLMKKQFNTLIILLVLPFGMMANGLDLGKYTKQKSIKKAYIVNPDAGIDIKNSYGNVFVTTWGEDKIELDILIKVSGDNEDWVNKRLDGIDVDIEALKHLVTAVTRISKSGSTGKNNSIEINYTVKIPKNGAVKINNQYGSILTTDLFASTNLNCKYGKLTSAKLNGNSNIIDIEYCTKSTIDYVKNAVIKADYSGLTIGDYGKIGLNADYTDINFINGNELKYDCNYGKLNFGKINRIDGNGDYLSIHANDVAEQLKINTDYSKITVDELGAKINSVAVTSGYTTVDLSYNPNFAFDFDVNVKYASFYYSKDVEMNSKQESGFSKSYQGYNKKSGENKVIIHSQFGNVTLNKK
jgi:hypothetical protein